MTRPISVTVICWVIIAFGLESLVGLISGLAGPIIKDVLASNPIPVSKAVWFGAGTAILHVVLAAFMLRGAAWARIVYFCLTALALAGVAVFPPPAAIIFVLVIKAVVFAYFLFRPEANKYFSQAVHAAA